MVNVHVWITIIRFLIYPHLQVDNGISHECLRNVSLGGGGVVQACIGYTEEGGGSIFQLLHASR